MAAGCLIGSCERFVVGTKTLLPRLSGMYLDGPEEPFGTGSISRLRSSSSLGCIVLTFVLIRAVCPLEVKAYGSVFIAVLFERYDFTRPR